MSHSKERAEKNCLNCGETVQGRYCQVCGQENIVPKETLLGLVLHFFQDITHFDGKFFSTGKLLFTKPGFLPKEYLKGRRASYLHPIRMYVFTSALFFLIFYSVFDVKNLDIGKKRTNKEEIASLAEAKARSLKTAKTKEDSAVIERTFRMIDQLPVDFKIEKKDLDLVADELIVENIKAADHAAKKNSDSVNGVAWTKKSYSPTDTTTNKPSTYRYRPGDANDSSLALNDLAGAETAGVKRYINPKRSNYNATGTSPKSGGGADSAGPAGSELSPGSDDEKDDAALSKRKRSSKAGDLGIYDLSISLLDAYNSEAEYDSVQASLPPKARDSWLKKQFQLQNIQFKQRYGDDEGALVQDLLDKFMHTFPYLLFISLPLYALFLKLLYIRRKQFFYADHGLFLIYLYIFSFLHLLVFFGLRAIHEKFDYWWIGLLTFIFVLYGIYYAYKSMKKFYEQRGFKTIIKFLIFNFLAFTTITILFMLFFFIALLRL